MVLGLSASFTLTGLNLVFAPVAEAGCNIFGCSQSRYAECNPFGCPNFDGDECTPHGCPPGEENITDHHQPIPIIPENSAANNDFQFCLDKLKQQGYSLVGAMKKCQELLEQ